MKRFAVVGLNLLVLLSACGGPDVDASGTYVLDIEDVRTKVRKQMNDKLAFMRNQLATMQSVAWMDHETAEDKENWKPEPEILEKIEQYEAEIESEEKRFQEVLRSYRKEPAPQWFELVLAEDGTFTSTGRGPRGEASARGTWSLVGDTLTLVTTHEAGVELKPASEAPLLYRDGVLKVRREKDPFPMLLRRTSGPAAR